MFNCQDLLSRIGLTTNITISGHIDQGITLHTIVGIEVAVIHINEKTVTRIEDLIGIILEVLVDNKQYIQCRNLQARSLL